MSAIEHLSSVQFPARPSEPDTPHFGPSDYWMSSPSEANRVGIPNVWRKNVSGWDLPDPDDM